ncbi:phage major capsid protein [Lachnospira eligens]|jgi:HK97 family phage major capsid protein|uniref:Phage major capsid protein n=1 Tax=Lachnospira eligens TaxID=39485 RepID=A0A7C9L2Y0_9FIRM|nr:phage major capsid protein [Lachnospira eligens]MSC57772.1 phage major capsid protein [Lachnospira eligens]DAJ79508.1 MAG TPA: major capsid protein [Caudoviricetes sp.]
MRLKEIELRLAAIKKDVEERGAQLTAEELAKYEKEVKDLQEERTAIIQQQEQRTSLLAAIAAGEVTDANGNPTAPTVLRSIKPADGSGAEQRTAVNKYETMEYRKAFMEYVTRGVTIPKEYRQDAVSQTTDVGAVIPTNVLNQIITKLESVGNILAKVTRTAYKGGVTIPKSTVKPVATWTTQGKGSDKQKQDTSGTVTFAYHKLRCTVAVSLEVDTMAITAFENLLINNIVEAMTKALEQAIISGTGVGQPKGITAETADAGQTVETAKPAYADLIAAEGNLPVAYEKGAEWCMSKKTYMNYYGLTDSNGQPIGRINYGLAGKPEYTLLGRPVNVCDYLPSFANAENNSIVGFLFNFKDYVLNTNYAMGVKKYEDNDTDDMVTKGIMLADGKVVDTGSYVPLKKVQAV